MELSSNRFKAVTVSAGISFWFFIISSMLNSFSIEIFIIFIGIIFTITQIISVKVSKALDIFAIYNTKIFLGVLFIAIISIYGVLFRFLRIDLLRLKKEKTTYWLNIESSNNDQIFKQY